MRKLTAALAGAALLASMVPALADSYGAIAVSPKLAWGWAGGKTTRAKAERKALANCPDYGCSVKLWVRNQCMALAIGRNAWGVGYAMSPRTAEGIAARKCDENGSGCRVKVSYCSR